MRGQRHAPTVPTPGKDPAPLVQEAGWASGPVWTGAEILAPIGIRSPDRPARRQSLYRLRYPAHGNCNTSLLKQYSLRVNVIFSCVRVTIFVVEKQ